MKKFFISLFLLSGGLMINQGAIYASHVTQGKSVSQQTITVKGVVVDESGQPVIGAGVVIKGTNRGVPTDMDGKFTIQASKNDILQISSIGYTTQEVKAGENIHVVLAADSAMLEEVVAVGYGTQKKVNLTGSVSTVSAKKLSSRPLNSVTQALQGQMPGVYITQNGGGQPGREAMSMQIRGRNSFSSGSAPLVIVDGIVAYSIDDVDINAVESVSVLKDAASAAIYGARAANGVILITTKKGKSGEKLNLTYSGKFLYQTPYMWQERIWDSPEYMRMQNEALDNSGGSWGKYTEEQIQKYENGGPSEEYPSYNYEKEFIKNIGIMTHNVAISGSNGNTNYYVGGNIWTQDGIIRNFKYNKYDFIANFESKVNDWIRFGVSSNFKISKQREPYVGTSTFMNSLFAMRPTWGPVIKGENGEPDRYVFYRYRGPEWTMMNPLALSREGGKTDLEKMFRLNAFLELDLLPGLKWNTKVAADYRVADISGLDPKIRFTILEPVEATYFQYGHTTDDVMNKMKQGHVYSLMSTLNYDKSFGEHNLNVLAGYSMEDTQMKILSAFRTNLPSIHTDQIDAGSTEKWTNGGRLMSDYSFVSLFGRINYNYKYKYLLELNARYDGSSRFPKGNRFGFFPSVSVAWRISEEDFVKDNVSFIDNLKIRASVGRMGNNSVSDFPYQGTMTGGLNYVMDGSKEIPGYARTALSNRSIRWETTDNYGVGVDATLWKGLLDVTLDVYSKRTTGILRKTQLPGYVGLGAPAVNQGVVSNKGFELTLGHRNHVNDFHYGINFNISKNWNKLVKFGAPELGNLMMKEGYEMNRYYVYQTEGLFQSQEEIDAAPEQLSPKNQLKPGDIRIKDVNGDGKVTPDDKVDMDGINPDFFYGGTVNLEWKGLDFSMFFQGVHGQRTSINDINFFPWGNGSSPLKIWRNAWSEDNKDTDIPLLRFPFPLFWNPYHQTIHEVSSWYLQNSSYFRLKNLSLGYTLPEKLFENCFIKSVRFAASAENVFTITPFRFGDPERKNSLTYPTLRTFSLSLDIKF